MIRAAASFFVVPRSFVVPPSLVAFALTWILAACGSEAPSVRSDAGSSSGAPRVDAASGDPFDAAPSPAADAGANAPPDARVDAGGAPGDLTPEIVPGSHVQVREARIHLGDTFLATRAHLGSGVRTPVLGTRSYDWSLSDGNTVTIWFANTNLDSDDAAPADVDDTDQVLWIAVKGAFPAVTDRGVGLGATREAVESPAAYGPAPATAIADDGLGIVAQYFTSGVVVTYDAADQVRALTVSRLYPRAPDGTLDVAGVALDFGAAGRLTGLRTSPTLLTGTPEADVRGLLGDPDASGEVMNGSQRLRVYSYGFIGLEVFFLGDRDTMGFVAVHAPYYGRTAGANGVGSARATIEAELGFGAGETATNPQLVCYPNRRAPRVGVSYGPDDRVTSLTMPLLLCP